MGGEKYKPGHSVPNCINPIILKKELLLSCQQILLVEK